MILIYIYMMDVIWDICNSCGFHNIIRTPTSFESVNGTLIDPVLVINKNWIIKGENMTRPNSDWYSLFGYVSKLHVSRQPNIRIINILMTNLSTMASLVFPFTFLTYLTIRIVSIELIVIYLQMYLTTVDLLETKIVRKDQ